MQKVQNISAAQSHVKYNIKKTISKIQQLGLTLDTLKKVLAAVSAFVIRQTIIIGRHLHIYLSCCLR